MPGSVHSLCPPHEDLPAPLSEVSAHGSALGANSLQLWVPAQFPGPYLSLPSSGLARGAWGGQVQSSLLLLCSDGAPTLLPYCPPQPNFFGVSPASPSKVFLWLWEEPGSRLLILVTIHPGKSTGVGCHFFLQGIFLTQGSNPGFLRYKQMLYCLSLQGS